MLFNFFRHDVAQALRKIADFFYSREDGDCEGHDGFLLHLDEWPNLLVSELIKHSEEEELELEVAIAKLVGMSLHILMEQSEKFHAELRDMLDKEAGE